MISCIIPTLNDAAECNATIKSIRDTAGDRVEIVVIDDASDTPLVLDDTKVILRRNPQRIGVDASRHLGAILASQPYLFLLDSHMRFDEGWHSRVIERIGVREKTLHCCTCVGLSPGNMDMRRPEQIYSGAYLRFMGEDEKTKEMQFFEGKWNGGELADDAEIGCVMGASYLIPRAFFFQIGGLKMLHSWGSSEPFLSLKTWLAGGEVRLMKSVRVGHQFRSKTNFKSKLAALLFNKLVSAELLFPKAASEHFSSLMNVHCQKPAELRLAREWLKSEVRHIECEKALMEAVLVRSLEEYL